MIYLVEIEGEEDQRVELVESRRGVWSAAVGAARPVEMEFRGRDKDGAYLLVLNGELRKFRLDKNCTRYLMDDGEQVTRFKVDRAGEVILDHAQRIEVRRQPSLDTLESSITGIVMEALVKPGDLVEAGQPVILIEAMKMENTLNAPITGRVDQIEVTSGQTVYAGDRLMSFSSV